MPKFFLAAQRNTRAFTGDPGWMTCDGCGAVLSRSVLHDPIDQRRGLGWAYQDRESLE